MALTHQCPPGVHQGSEKRFGCPFLGTDALEEMDEVTQCSEGTLFLDPFHNHDAANSDEGPSRKGTSPPNLLSHNLDAHDWLPLPVLQSLHLTLGTSTAGDAPSPSLSL